MAIRIVSPPAIRFTCSCCGAENEGDPADFEELHLSPPQFLATCGFCRMRVVCYPRALISLDFARKLAALREPK